MDLKSLFTTVLVAACFLQTANGQVAPVPIADHHTHIWSINASRLVTEPLPPTVELPAELNQLLRDKEHLGKLRSIDAIKQIYTPDASVMDPGGPLWLRGEAAINYVANSTVINKLYPTSFELNGTGGYIAGTEISDENGVVTPLSNFLYVLNKGTDGRWRISAESFTLNGQPVAKERSVEDLIRGLDASGVRKAAILSVAYWFGNPRRNVQDQYPKVRAENDWIAQQAAKYPDRLAAFFSFNPLSDYALEEIERCAKNPIFKGIKLHIGNGRIDMLDPNQVAKLKTVFASANRHKLPIIIHLWTTDPAYGAPHSKVFLEQVLPAAPDIPIQIAHMAATGPGYTSDAAMEVFANAAAAGDLRMKNVYFDVASDVIESSPASLLELVAKRLRQVGMKKILFASDWSPGSQNENPQKAWQSFRRLPLTEEEFRIVANNVAPYLR